MARRERERYTERNRPGRPAAGTGPVDEGPALKNPAVLVAIAGLVVAGAMALGFIFGRGDSPETADLTEAVETPAAELDAAAGDAAAEAPASEDAAAESAAEGAAPADSGAEAEADDTSARANLYSAWEDQGLDPETTAYFATIETDKGSIELELFPDVAPQHVNSFIFLAREGFYDGLNFHRVEPGFVIQGGDPLGNGSGGPGYSVPAEFNSDNPVPHRIGSLAMARSSDPNSAGSQFYIVLADGPAPTSLDGQYTVFGHTVGGMGTVLSVQRGDVIKKITITEKPKSESVTSADDIRAGKLPEGIE